MIDLIKIIRYPLGRRGVFPGRGRFVSGSIWAHRDWRVVLTVFALLLLVGGFFDVFVVWRIRRTTFDHFSTERSGEIGAEAETIRQAAGVLKKETTLLEAVFISPAPPDPSR